MYNFIFKSDNELQYRINHLSLALLLRRKKKSHRNLEFYFLVFLFILPFRFSLLTQGLATTTVIYRGFGLESRETGTDYVSRCNRRFK